MTSKADQDRLDALHDMPCICCEIEGVAQLNETSAHHIVDKGYRKHSGGHQATLPLCLWHHQGYPPLGFTNDYMLYHYGPSLERHKKLFNETYGGERKLLERVNAAA